MNKPVTVQAHSIYKLITFLLATLLLSVSMGMNAIIFPVTMDNLNFTESSIGLILASETIGALLVCFVMQWIFKTLGMFSVLIFTLAIRSIALLFITESELEIEWLGLVFFHGVGAYFMIMLLQVKICSMSFGKRQTLVNALYGMMISIGYALGPLVVEHHPLSELQTLPLLATLPMPNDDNIILSGLFSILSGLLLLTTNIKYQKSEQGVQISLLNVIRRSPGVYGAIANSGVVIFGIAAFITLYGMRNGMDVYHASLLLTAFTAGCIVLEPLYAWLSSYFDLRYFLFANAFVSLVFSIFLPLAIYDFYPSVILLFLWGGSNASSYSVALTLLAERFKDNEMVAANAGFSLMDSLGGTVGIICIGVVMQFFGSEGLPYVIIAASVFYFSYALTRYKIT